MFMHAKQSAMQTTTTRFGTGTTQFERSAGQTSASSIQLLIQELRCSSEMSTYRNRDRRRVLIKRVQREIMMKEAKTYEKKEAMRPLNGGYAHRTWAIKEAFE